MGKVKFFGQLGIDFGEFLIYYVENGNIDFILKIASIPII